MKRSSLVTASILLAFTGCTCGQGGRPGFFGRLCDRNHSNNVGAPCASGVCATAPAIAAPAIAAPAMANAGCDNCGTGVQSYGYEGSEGYPISSYGGEVVRGTYGGVIQNAPSYNVENVPGVRVQ